jgi:hypothetical protein
VRGHAAGRPGTCRPPAAFAWLARPRRRRQRIRVSTRMRENSHTSSVATSACARQSDLGTNTFGLSHVRHARTMRFESGQTLPSPRPVAPRDRGQHLGGRRYAAGESSVCYRTVGRAARRCRARGGFGR